MSKPANATGSGLRTTKLAQRFQKPASRSVPSTIRFGMTRTLLMRWPSIESIAGNSVIAARTETVGISMPPMPIDRMNGSGSTSMLSRPTATVEPEMITERPACCMVVITAPSASWPWRSSSRKRKIISRA
jgi:hypothetical protein